ncbi:hypothetical protein Pfo_005269 [Paulownia fortunei]|nr:hypothetical protein Pfo_005269 [Paulownia fortunei]
MMLAMVLIDYRSLVDILLYEGFNLMDMGRAKLQPANTTLFGFVGGRIRLLCDSSKPKNLNEDVEEESEEQSEGENNIEEDGEVGNERDGDEDSEGVGDEKVSRDGDGKVIGGEGLVGPMLKVSILRIVTMICNLNPMMMGRKKHYR